MSDIKELVAYEKKLIASVLYYYISGQSGMKANGSFTKDKSKWITFDNEEKRRIEDGGKPYGATKVGAFVKTDKF